MKAFCEDCQSTQEIAPTDHPVGETGSARRWRFKQHICKADRDKPLLVVELCPGSNKLV